MVVVCGSVCADSRDRVMLVDFARSKPLTVEGQKADLEKLERCVVDLEAALRKHAR